MDLTIFGLCLWGLWQDQYRWIWPFAAILLGASILGFVVLLHEQVHKIIFARNRPRWNRLFGLLYGLPSGISATQFKRWHLDHHDELGNDEDDPKRAHLSPKKNTRLTKLLYMTPMLFVIYAIASKTEAKTYPEDEQRIIVRERLFNVVMHVAFVAFLWNHGGFFLAFRVWLFPFLFCFPPAFVINRLGQHFDIDRSDPAKWSTLVNGNPLIRFLFLWSNHHIEHHYFQRVPFYRLTELNRKLQPFFKERGNANRGYFYLLWNWLVLNKKAHTNWSFPG